MPQIDKTEKKDSNREIESPRAERDVVDAFMAEHFCPTPDDLARHQALHPQHSAALREAASDTIAIRLMTGVFRREDAPGPTEEDYERELRIVSAEFHKVKKRRPSRDVNR